MGGRETYEEQMKSFKDKSILHIKEVCLVVQRGAQVLSKGIK